jgi:hypothetical protein
MYEGIMFDSLRQIPAQIAAVFDRLNDRERRIGIVALAVIVIGLVAYFVTDTLATMSRKTSQISQNKSMLSEVYSLADNFRRAKAKQEEQQRRYSAHPVSLFTHLQKAAQRYGIALTGDLNETSTPLKDSNITETSVTLNLKSLSLDRFHAFINQIEESDYNGVVKVTRIKTKQRFDAPDLIDVTLTVSTWKTNR